MALRPICVDLSGFPSSSDGPDFSTPGPVQNFMETSQIERMQLEVFEENIPNNFPVNHHMQLRPKQQQNQFMHPQSPQCYLPVASFRTESQQLSGANFTEALGRVELPEHLAPMSTEDQEKLKLERKRERNRIAAAKCRRKKLERIAYEEERISLYKAHIQALKESREYWENELRKVRLEAWDHVQAYCNIPVTKERLIVKFPSMIGLKPNLNST